MDRTTLRVDQLWRDGAWQHDVRIGVEETGMLGVPDEHTEQHLGWVLPGMPNLHSHAFQRAMAGLAERRGPGDDSFWTWREAMYAFASRIGPDDLKAIATQLYVEMLKAGYTHVCEFHYLHQRPDGRPYEDAAAMSRALIEAADEAGIGMTLLPVLYRSGGFDSRPLNERQRRFGLTVEAYLRLIEQLRAEESPMLRIGAALHSLRAVPESALREVLAAEPLRQGPIHIHIAEQVGEVQDCLALRNVRPVRWLLDHATVDARWCLVHATHLDEDEVTRLAGSGAVAGLCPTTEANLGDGLFALADYLDADGRLGIGSDSHISVSPVEELRWLEYGQRLRARHRNIASRQRGASVGEHLWQAALAGGAQASDLPLGACEIDARADLLVLDEDAPQLAARDGTSMLDSFLFAGNAPLVRDVMVGGAWVVRDFRHRDEARIAARYRSAVEALRATA
ncbi:formimidoylglutamate deiminase [Oleiagrimonas citrea]|uniref:Formimidoylglutamate deiminase n=1 Tax=Oleiagrimonas citrea TaxID=1665687 RepID=A0A846ZMV7_9GAMM|nr:formimidoylglutamate deiminase [Oleiagrimonas citrea]NKZ38859.1 formimidoylglutamate deiminase [Oleiagrimonas citrea]